MLFWGKSMATDEKIDWHKDIFDVLRKQNISLIAHVPDAGHTSLIDLCEMQSDMDIVTLTTEEEGVGLLCGAWSGNRKGVLLMQSSGVGNCINALASITRACNFPLLMLVTMRGEWNEFNSWQVPMGKATEKVLSALYINVVRCETADEVQDTVYAMMGLAYKSNSATAVLLSQRLIGSKTFKE